MTEEIGIPNPHEHIVQQYEIYLAEHQKFTEKGVKAAAGRARKALQEMSKAIKLRRKEITDQKAALTAK
jgi:predicted metal-dependent phosphotriesterase family hydrolase